MICDELDDLFEKTRDAIASHYSASSSSSIDGTLMKHILQKKRDLGETKVKNILQIHESIENMEISEMGPFLRHRDISLVKKTINVLSERCNSKESLFSIDSCGFMREFVDFLSKTASNDDVDSIYRTVRCILSLLEYGEEKHGNDLEKNQRSKAGNTIAEAALRIGAMNALSSLLVHPATRSNVNLRRSSLGCLLIFSGLYGSSMSARKGSSRSSQSLSSTTPLSSSALSCEIGPKLVTFLSIPVPTDIRIVVGILSNLSSHGHFVSKGLVPEKERLENSLKYSIDSLISVILEKRALQERVADEIEMALNEAITFASQISRQASPFACSLPPKIAPSVCKLLDSSIFRALKDSNEKGAAFLSRREAETQSSILDLLASGLPTQVPNENDYSALSEFLAHSKCVEKMIIPYLVPQYTGQRWDSFDWDSPLVISSLLLLSSLFSVEGHCQTWAEYHRKSFLDDCDGCRLLEHSFAARDKGMASDTVASLAADVATCIASSSQLAAASLGTIISTLSKSLLNLDPESSSSLSILRCLCALAVDDNNVRTMIEEGILRSLTHVLKSSDNAIDDDPIHQACKCFRLMTETSESGKTKETSALAKLTRRAIVLTPGCLHTLVHLSAENPTLPQTSDSFQVSLDVLKEVFSGTSALVDSISPILDPILVAGVVWVKYSVDEQKRNRTRKRGFEREAEEPNHSKETRYAWVHLLTSVCKSVNLHNSQVQSNHQLDSCGPCFAWRFVVRLLDGEGGLGFADILTVSRSDDSFRLEIASFFLELLMALKTAPNDQISLNCRNACLVSMKLPEKIARILKNPNVQKDDPPLYKVVSHLDDEIRSMESKGAQRPLQQGSASIDAVKLQRILERLNADQLRYLVLSLAPYVVDLNFADAIRECMKPPDQRQSLQEGQYQTASTPDTGGESKGDTAKMVISEQVAQKEAQRHQADQQKGDPNKLYNALIKLMSADSIDNEEIKENTKTMISETKLIVARGRQVASTLSSESKSGDAKSLIEFCGSLEEQVKECLVVIKSLLANSEDTRIGERYIELNQLLEGSVLLIVDIRDEIEKRDHVQRGKSKQIGGIIGKEQLPFLDQILRARTHREEMLKHVDQNEVISQREAMRLQAPSDPFSKLLADIRSKNKAHEESERGRIRLLTSSVVPGKAFHSSDAQRFREECCLTFLLHPNAVLLCFDMLDSPDHRFPFEAIRKYIPNPEIVDEQIACSFNNLGFSFKCNDYIDHEHQESVEYDCILKTTETPTRNLLEAILEYLSE